MTTMDMSPDIIARARTTKIYQGLHAKKMTGAFPLHIFATRPDLFDVFEAAWDTEAFAETLSGAGMGIDGEPLTSEAFSEIARLSEQWNATPDQLRPVSHEPRIAKKQESTPDELMFNIELSDSAFEPYDGFIPSLDVPAHQKMSMHGASGERNKANHDPHANTDSHPSPPLAWQKQQNLAPSPHKPELPAIEFNDPAPIVHFNEPHHKKLANNELSDLLPNVETPEPLPTPVSAPAAADAAAIFRAIEQRDVVALESLTSQKLPWPQKQKWTPATLCAYKDWAEGIDIVHKNGYSLGEADSSGSTPISWGHSRKSWQALELMVRLGEIFDLGPKRPALPALFSAGAPESLLIACIESGAPPMAADSKGAHPIHLAAQRGFRLTCEALVRAKVRLDIPDSEGRLPKDIAKFFKHFELAHYLQREGFRGNAEKIKTEVRQNETDEISRPSISTEFERLTQALSNKTSASTDPPLATISFIDSKKAHQAIHEKKVHLLAESLIPGGKWPRSETLQLPHLCAQANWPEGAAICAKAGFGPFTTDAKGLTPFDMALAHHSWLHLFWLLEQPGKPTDFFKPNHLTSIIAQGADASIIAAMLAAGANPNVIDSNGNAAIHIAASTGRRDACATLLAAKARLDLPNRSGSHAREIAKSSGHPDLAIYLQREAFKAKRE